jgi:hypothetical protein
MPIKKLFATIAPIAPGGVEFQIHHVVPTFHVNIASKAYKKKRIRLGSWSAIYNKGIQAIKIRGVKAETGHAKMSSRPVIKLNKSKGFFFK